MRLESHLPLLLDLLLKSVLLAVLAAGLLRLTRATSAANRHLVALAAIVTLLLLPLTKLAPPHWSYSWKAAALAPVVIQLAPIMPAGAASDTAAAAALTPSAPLVKTVSRVDASGLIVGAWLAGVALLLLRRGWLGWQGRRVVWQSRPVTAGRLQTLVHEIAFASGVGAEVRFSGACQVPFAFGVLRPVVVLPEAASDWSDPRLSAALRHELGHIRRRDCLTRWLADLACALYWVNPAVWLVARELRLAQEQACDDLVLSGGIPPEQYASQLVQLVRSVGQERWQPAPAMVQRSTLEQRVRALVDGQRRRGPQTLRATVAGVLSVVCALALCQVAQVLAAEPDKAAPAVSRGLAYLAGRQQEDGSVGDGQWRGSVGLTSLAGLALLGEPAHAARVKRVADFLLSCQNADGYLGVSTAKRGSMYDHGYATLFLAEYAQASPQPGLPEKLAKAVGVIVQSQGKEGGWRYSPTPGDGDTSVSACQLMALVAARQAGVEVPEAVFGAGAAFLKRCQNADGGFGYTGPGSSAFARSAAALSASLASAPWAPAAAKADAATGAEYVLGFLPASEPAASKTQFYIHGQYYAGQALRLLGGDTWQRGRTLLRESLLAAQQPDGSWSDGPTPELATSEACLALRMQAALAK